MNDQLFDCRKTDSSFAYWGGGSGAGVLNDSGELVGVFSGYMDQLKIQKEGRIDSLPEQVGRYFDLARLSEKGRV